METYKHRCETCQYYTSDKRDWNKHLKTYRHARILLGIPILKKQRFKCECGTDINYSSFYNHKKTKRHITYSDLKENVHTFLERNKTCDDVTNHILSFLI